MNDDWWLAQKEAQRAEKAERDLAEARAALAQWTSDLETARVELCQFLVTAADDGRVSFPWPELGTKLRDAEAALTLLSDIIDRARDALSETE
jgi:hypothetical protein